MASEEYRVSSGSSSEQRWYLLEGADSKVKWLVVSLLALSALFIIAGSVMLGIGLSQNNSGGNTQTVIGETMFVSAASTLVNYSYVQSNYQMSVDMLTSQMTSALASSSKASFVLAAQSSPPVTIVGISPADNGVMVMYGLAYTNQNAPSNDDIYKKISAQPKLKPLSVIDSTPKTLNNMVCATVSNVVPLTTTSKSPPTGTTKSGPTGAPGSTITTIAYTGTTVVNTGSTVTKLTNAPATGSTTTSNTPSSNATTTSKSPITNPTNVPVTGSTTTRSGNATTASTTVSTTTKVLVPGERQDVLILLDDSNANLNSTNFDLVKNWLINTLIPLWTIGESDVEIAFVTYASNEFNILMDFDEVDKSDIINVINAQSYSGKYGPSITQGLRGAVDLKGTRNVPQATILISASSNLTDIEAAAPFAHQLVSSSVNQVITINLASSDSGKLLGLLSSGQSRYFGVSGFQLSGAIARQIASDVFNTISTFAPPLTTVPVLPDLSCHADVTIILDNSNDVGDITEYQKQIEFIGNTLVPTWPLSPAQMEIETIVYAQSEGAVILLYPFEYENPAEFNQTLTIYRNMYFPNSPQSIAGSLDYLAGNLDNRRNERQQVTLLFTYSSSQTDIAQAYFNVDKINSSLVIAAVGNNVDVKALQQLTGNVVAGSEYSVDFANKISSSLCSITTKSPLVTPTTSTTVTTTTPTTTSVSTTTSTPPPTTTTTVIACPDCVPKASNVLFVLEAYNKDKMSSQKALLSGSLTSTWTHFERIAVFGSDTNDKFLDPIDFDDLQNREEFLAIIDSLQPFSDEPSLASAFKTVNARMHQDASFGSTFSFIFTTVTDSNDISAAATNSQILRQKGQVTIIGVGQTDVSIYKNISDNALPWADTSNTDSLIKQINQILGL